MRYIPPISPFAIVSERLVQLEQMLSQPEKGGKAWQAIDIVRDLRRRFDQIGFLYDTSRRLIENLPLREVLDLIVDILWRQQYSFVVVLLGETELGPYLYQEMRGVVDPLRFHGKECPLPLWGELAHALVRRLDPDEPDYLIVSDMAALGRPKQKEFPWLERHGSLMIVPLRKDHIAMGALLLGRREPNGFDDPELCAELVEIAASAAMALYHSQMRHELQERADQLVGLQLFTKSLADDQSLAQILTATAAGIADLLGNVDVYLLVLRRQLPDTISGDALGYHLRLPWEDLCVISNRAPEPTGRRFRLVSIAWSCGRSKPARPCFLTPKKTLPCLRICTITKWAAPCWCLSSVAMPRLARSWPWPRRTTRILMSRTWSWRARWRMPLRLSSG